jgi:hypothetical protein
MSLRSTAVGLAGFYGAIADEVAHHGWNGSSPALIPAPPQTGPAVPRTARAGESLDGQVAAVPHPHLLWVQEHLHHLGASAQTVSEPALHLAVIRRRPWWR